MNWDNDRKRIPKRIIDEVNSHPEMIKFMKDDVKRFLDSHEKNVKNAKQHGAFLKEMLLQLIKQLPEMGAYMGYALEEAKKRGYQFGDYTRGDEKLI